MAKKEQNGCAVLALVAFAAFLLGRCSADDRETPDPSPAALYGAGAVPARDGAGAADAVVADREADDVVASEPEPEPPPARFVSPAPSRISGTAFRNCSEARAAGAAPIMAGDPGYAPRLDRDGDGVGCE